MGTGRSRSDVSQGQRVRQLSRALLTLMSAPATSLGVGWLVLTDRWSGAGDRLQTLQSRHRPYRADQSLRTLQPALMID